MTPEEFQRLSELFETIIRQPPENREACIDTLSAGNEEFRQELRVLVESHRENDQFLESGVIEDIEDAEAPLPAGRSIAHYTIERQLGRGGMGIVYLAHDTRLNRRVAVKELHSHLVADATQRERFRREARAAASISHPAVATVHALEELDGHFNIVSEYVPGETLAETLERSGLSADEALRIALQVAEGLADAHGRGVVHRDLKPQNVIRTPQGQPKIIDFGLANIHDSDSTDQHLTQTGLLMGTPGYMSPEQLRGETVDFRADIFSFGILLYELLGGTHPFRDRTAAATTAAILGNEPPSLTGIDTRFDAILRRCLRKEPGDRYSSTRELVEDLRSIAAVPKTPIPPPAAKDRLDRAWWGFHQAAVVLLYAVTIMVVWDIREQSSGNTLLLFYGVLASAIGNGTLRVHLLFTSRFNAAALRSEMKRVRRWTTRIDWCFTALLVAAAAAILPELQLISGVLAAIVVVYLVVFLVIEPATTRAVFPDSDSAGD